MSDNWIILIPESAGYIPPESKQKSAIAKLRELTSKADEVNVEVSEKTRFEDCGGNFESVACPDCGAKIEMEWWQERMSEDHGDDEGFKLKPIELTCCGANRTLHELRYEFPQGFARFSLTTMNPNIGEMPKESVTALERILECPLRVIYRHM